MAYNLVNLSNHFASSALISSILQLDNLKDDFLSFCAGVAFFFSVALFSQVLPGLLGTKMDWPL